MTAVAFDRVSVTLEDARVVEHVDLAVEDGEWLGLIGPNGAGKTTLLRAVAGMVAYDGSVRLWGEEVGALPRRQIARRIALVPQVPLMPDEMTVLEYALLGRTPHLSYAAKVGEADLDAARNALGRLELTGFAQRRLGSLSGGERQRVVLARAIAQDASLLLLDEPTSALDVGAQQQVLELVSSLRAQSGLTVLSAMHDLTLAGQYADRLVLVDRGRHVASGTPAEVLTEELVARHYGASVRVLSGETGVAVVPLRRSRPADVED